MTTSKALMKVEVNISAYPDELPPKLIREYAPLIAKPLSVTSCDKHTFFANTMPGKSDRDLYHECPIGSN